MNRRRSRRVHPTSRAGLALPAAVFTLAIIVLFIAGSAFATTQEARASVGTLTQRVALEAAEYGVASVLRDWDRAWNAATPVGQTLGPFVHTVAGGATATVRLTRTGTTTWWAVSEGTAGGPIARRAARRTIGAAFRLDLSVHPVDAALAVADSARVSGTGVVAGADSVELLAACGMAAVPVAGVASPDTTRTCDGACGGSGAGITGTPRLLVDSGTAARVAALRASLVADVVLPAGAVVTPGPVTAGASCDSASTSNWGDPFGSGPCAHRLAVISALGDVTIRGGMGQGILLAAGDVVLEGGAMFAGIVVAQDDIVTGAGGGTVLGAVLAADARPGPGDHSHVGDRGSVRRSSCRVRRARLGSASPVRVLHRWWAEFG
jgi:hypothetical protein